MNSDETKELITKVVIYCYPIVLIMGAVGNVFSFIIFSRNKFRNTSFSLYFRVLAFSDTFTLLYIINDIPNALFGHDLQNRSYFWCKIFRYGLYSIAPVSGWILVVVSLDRMLSIIKPNKFLFMKQTKTQIIICILILVFDLIYYIPLILYKDYQKQTNLSNNTSELVYKCVNLEEERIVDWMDLVNSTLLPFLGLAISTTITLNKLFKSRSKTVIEIKNTNIQNTKLKKRDIKFAVISVVLNILFFVFNLPVCVYYLVLTYAEMSVVDANLFFYVTAIWYYLNFGVVFYVNLSANPVFKNELLVFLHLRKYLDKQSSKTQGKSSLN